MVSGALTLVYVSKIGNVTLNSMKIILRNYYFLINKTYPRFI